MTRYDDPWTIIDDILDMDDGDLFDAPPDNEPTWVDADGEEAP